MSPAGTVNVGKYFRDRRIERRLTQTQVARAVGVSQYTISKWETGNTRPTADNLDRLLVVLDIDVDAYARRVNETSIVAAIERVAVAIEVMTSRLTA